MSDRRSFLNLIHQITVQADEATTINELLELAIQHICETLNLPVGHAFMSADYISPILQSTALWYLDSPQKYETFRTASECITPELGLGGIKQVVRDRKPCWFTHISQRSDYVRADVAREVGIQTGIFLPIFSGQETIGVLEFYSEQVFEPDHNLLDVLAQIGLLLGRSIERKRSNSVIYQSKAWFQSLFEFAPTGIVIIDESGYMLMVNEKACTMFSYKHSELVGKQLEILLAEQIREVHKNHLKHYFAEPQPREMGVGLDLTGYRKDGSEFPVEVVLSSVPTHESLLAIAFITDISDHQQALNALHERENILTVSLRAARAGVWTWDLKSNMFVWDETIEQMHGLKPGFFRGTYAAWKKHIHPDDLHGAVEAIQQSMEGGPQLDIEFRVIWPNGDMRYLLTRALVIHENNKPVRMIGVSIDITERKKADEALRLSEERFRRAVLGSPFPSMIHAEDGEVILINRAWQTITGYGHEDIPTIKAWTEKAHGKRAKSVRTAIEKLYELDEIVHEGEFEITTKDGLRRIWDFSSTPLGKQVDGRRVILSKAADITKSKEAEKQIRTLNIELEKRVQERTANLLAVNKELEAFSYSVSHDLRSPLRAINGFSQALVEDYYDLLDDMGRDFLNRIRAESQRMGELIDDLIALSRFTRTTMTVEEVDLSEMVREIGTELQTIEPQRSVEFCVHDSVLACADKSLIRVVLQNLISNAWKFTGKTQNARIEFGSVQRDTAVEYYVHDNGAGFDMAYVNKLFGAFQRLHAMDEFPGTGIGLATVQRIIHRHSGTVRAEGEVDRGATFYFTLDNGGCQ